MPIDIASGIVRLEYEDVSIPGKINLVWDRRYSTALLIDPPTALGQGWTCRYFATLTKRSNEFEFFTPEGSIEIFPDPDEKVERGGFVRQLGAFMEIFKVGQNYVIQSWNVDTGKVWRYRFINGQPNSPWPLVSIEDISGQGVDIAWDKQGKLAGVQQRLEKRALLFSYTQNGFIERVVLRAASGERYELACYEYDIEGRQVTARDVANFSDRYEYDSNGRLTREIVKDGGVFTYRYDHKSRCVKTSGLDRYQEKHLRFLDATSMTEVTDSYDRTFRYQHLPSGQMVREIDPIGNERTTDYDGYGRIIAKTDATGTTSRCTYDHAGNRASITDGLGNTYKFTYNGHHLPLSMTDPLKQVWQRIYDSANRLIGTIDPLGHRWLIHYDAEGNVAKIQNPLGACKYQRYTQGVLNEITDWMGNITRFYLDVFGRVSERHGMLGEITRFRYDLLGNPIQVNLPNGTILHATYDNVGNMTKFIDGYGHTTLFQYGPCRRLLKRIDPTGGVVQYVWGSEPGQLEQIINEKGEKYTFFRDEVGQIIREKSFDGAERQFQYNEEGYTTAYINTNGETITIQRDALHRIVGQTLPDNEQITYAYNPIGDLISAINSDAVVDIERDSLGRIVREVQGQQWVESDYDAVGNLIRTTTSFGHTVNYELDANGFVKKLTTLGNQSLEFKRNAYGQETSRQTLNGVVMEQRYDDLGRLVEQCIGPGRLCNSDKSVTPTQREIIYRNYAYDLNSSIISIADGEWGRADYIYDPAERLLQALHEQGSSETFSYDAAGNITHLQTKYTNSNTDETLVYGLGNCLLQKGNTFYEYNKGRLIKKIEEANSDNSKIWIYEWDALNRLKAVSQPDGIKWQYKYDALSRRIEKIGPNKRRQFLWDKDVMIHESDGIQSLSVWMFDNYSFAPLATVQKSQMYSIINDHLGTPIKLIDNSGSVVWSIALNPHGQKLCPVLSNAETEVATGIEQNLRFQGQYFDAETGLHYNRFRYYDPDCGRFISKDPIGLEGGYNLYQYAPNPVNWVDPLGLSYTVSPDRRTHILEGDPPGTGHGPNRGNSPGSFPNTWTDQQAISAIERVANSPNSTWKQATGPGFLTAPITTGGPDPGAPTETGKGTPVRFKVQGRDHSQTIEVIVEPEGEGIITGYCK